MSGTRFKQRVAKVLAKHIPSHLQHKYRITYYIEWRDYRAIRFVLWSQDGEIAYVVLRGLCEMFESTNITITNYRAQDNRVADVKDEWGEWKASVGSRDGIQEEELFVITIKDADFTKIFTHKDDEELSEEAKRFELEE